MPKTSLEQFHKTTNICIHIYIFALAKHSFCHSFTLNELYEIHILSMKQQYLQNLKPQYLGHTKTG